VNNIYVGNLDNGATEQVIRGLFESHGTVQRVKRMTDRRTGEFRGFAFVLMSTPEEAGHAIAALNGTFAHGRALEVRAARPQLHPAGRTSDDRATRL
jgi:RNA recognition motif-containing protein